MTTPAVDTINPPATGTEHLPDGGADAAALAAAAAAQAAAAAGDGTAPLDLETPPPPEDTSYSYEPTGDGGLDMALAFIGNQGFGHDSPEVQAALSGDFTKLEEAFKARGDKAKGYQLAITAGKEAYARKVTNISEAEKANRATIETAAGGASQWAAIQKWAATAADPAEKKTINAALKLGGVVAEDMVRRLAASFEASGMSAAAAKSATKETAGSGPAAVAANTGPLGSADFSRAVTELGRKLGAHKLYDSAEYKQLKARRLAAGA